MTLYLIPKSNRRILNFVANSHKNVTTRALSAQRVNSAFSVSYFGLYFRFLLLGFGLLVKQNFVFSVFRNSVFSVSYFGLYFPYRDSAISASFFRVRDFENRSFDILPNSTKKQEDYSKPTKTKSRDGSGSICIIWESVAMYLKNRQVNDVSSYKSFTVSLSIFLLLSHFFQFLLRFLLLFHLSSLHDSFSKCLLSLFTVFLPDPHQSF